MKCMQALKMLHSLLLIADAACTMRKDLILFGNCCCCCQTECRAAAAAAAGDYLSAKQLSSEARALKAAADEAHAAAALKIEVANNINSNAGLVRRILTSLALFSTAAAVYIYSLWLCYCSLYPPMLTRQLFF